MVAKIKKTKILNTENLLILVVFGLIGLFIAKSDIYIKTTFQGIKLWALVVLPSLLPFFFLTALLTASGGICKLALRAEKFSRIIYNAQGISVYIRLMSILSGYPIGAKIISDLYTSGLISKNQAEKYCTFTSTSGPLFIVGSVAIGMYGNKFYGFIMLIAHITASMLVGIIFRKMPDNGPIAAYSENNYDSVLYNAVYNAVVSVLIVGGFIALFFTLSQMAEDIKLLYPITEFFKLFLPENIATGLSAGLIECTRGTMLLSHADGGKLSVSLSCALISFGGLSVWFQSLAYLKKACVRLRIFAVSKILHTVISFCLCYILLTVL